MKNTLPALALCAAALTGCGDKSNTYITINEPNNTATSGGTTNTPSGFPTSLLETGSAPVSNNVPANTTVLTTTSAGDVYTVSLFDVPKSSSGSTVLATEITGVAANQNTFVGIYMVAGPANSSGGSAALSYAYEEKNGQIQYLFPGYTATNAEINNSGSMIAVNLVDQYGNSHVGFQDQNGNTAIYDAPNVRLNSAAYTYPSGYTVGTRSQALNDTSALVYYVEENGFGHYSLLDLSHGLGQNNWSLTVDPLAAYSSCYPVAMTDGMSIIACLDNSIDYTSTAYAPSYLLTKTSQGNYASNGYHYFIPGNTAPFIESINDQGEIVGTMGGNNTILSFIASADEPGVFNTLSGFSGGNEWGLFLESVSNDGKLGGILSTANGSELGVRMDSVHGVLFRPITSAQIHQLPTKTLTLGSGQN